MKKLSVILVCLTFGFAAYGQTEFNNFELNYKGGYSATPVEIIEVIRPCGTNTTDTIRMGEANGYEFGGAAYLDFGLGVEFNYGSHNRYFDTLAGSGSSYSVGLAFRKASFGSGSLFDAGFNTAFKVGAGYIHAEKTDQIEYINAEGSRIWTREKSFSGFYADGKLDIFRDNPFESSDYLFYGVSLSAGIKYPMMNKLSESSNGKASKSSWNKEDSVSIVNIGLEIKPVIIPISNRIGVSLITGISYGNFNSYNVHSPGVNFKVGLSLDGFTKFGECARVTYTRVSRDNYVSNEISFGVELIQLATTLFGK